MSATILNAGSKVQELTLSPETVESVKEELSRAKSIGLFLVSPFIGLAYAMAMPFFGIAMIIHTGYQAYRAKSSSQD